MQTRRFLEFGRSDRVIERVWWKCRAKRLFEGESWPTIISTYGHALTLDSLRNGLFCIRIRKAQSSSPVYITAEPVHTDLLIPSPPSTPISTYLSLPPCFPPTRIITDRRQEYKRLNRPKTSQPKDCLDRYNLSPHLLPALC